MIALEEVSGPVVQEAAGMSILKKLEAPAILELQKLKVPLREELEKLGAVEMVERKGVNAAKMLEKLEGVRMLTVLGLQAENTLVKSQNLAHRQIVLPHFWGN